MQQHVDSNIIVIKYLFLLISYYLLSCPLFRAISTTIYPASLPAHESYVCFAIGRGLVVDLNVEILSREFIHLVDCHFYLSVFPIAMVLVTKLSMFFNPFVFVGCRFVRMGTAGFYSFSRCVCKSTSCKNQVLPVEVFRTYLFPRQIPFCNVIWFRADIVLSQQTFATWKLFVWGLLRWQFLHNQCICSISFGG